MSLLFSCDNHFEFMFMKLFQSNKCDHSFLGVTEFPVTGGLVGELFANILADGFSRSRKGDRLFFESRQSGLNNGKYLRV